MSNSIEERIASIVAERVEERLRGLEVAVANVTTTSEEPLLDKKALAAWAGCSERTVETWMRHGCPLIRMGGPKGSPRFKASEVWTWLQTREEAG